MTFGDEKMRIDQTGWENLTIQLALKGLSFVL